MTTASSQQAMAVEINGSSGRAVAERNFRRAILITVGCVILFWGLYYLEREVLKIGPRAVRFVGEPTEAAMRYVTLPHFIIAFLFMMSSPKNHTSTKRLWIAGLMAAGAALCIVFGVASAVSLPIANIMATSVYVYFLVHELRDEAMFYTALGDAPPIHDRRQFANLVRAMVGLTVFGVLAVGWTPVPFGFLHQAGFYLVDPAAPMANKVLLVVTPLAGWGVATLLTLRYFARAMGFGSAAALVRYHAPLFRLMGGVAAVLGLSLVLTQRAYSLIIFHVAVWYVFACYQLNRHPPKTPSRTWWGWMRTTPTGFRFLHIGMIVAMMLLGLFWTVTLDKSPALAWLLSEDAFMYWTIMHITVSFVPR